MKILATDLDRTLLPNGSWPRDADAIEMFNELTTQQDVLVVYVTGRNLQLTTRAIAEFGVRHPSVLCADVGTTIRTYHRGEWTLDEGWSAQVRGSESAMGRGGDTRRDCQCRWSEGARERTPELVQAELLR